MQRCSLLNVYRRVSDCRCLDDQRQRLEMEKLDSHVTWPVEKHDNHVTFLSDGDQEVISRALTAVVPAPSLAGPPADRTLIR